MEFNPEYSEFLAGAAITFNVPRRKKERVAWAARSTSP